MLTNTWALIFNVVIKLKNCLFLSAVSTLNNGNVWETARNSNRLQQWDSQLPNPKFIHFDIIRGISDVL